MNDTTASPGNLLNRLSLPIPEKISGGLLWQVKEDHGGASHRNPEASKAAEFIQLLEEHRGECHLVVLHAFPDPDAISTGYTHRLISAHYGIEVDIVYAGEISHPQNQALVRMLGNNFHRYTPEMDFNGYDGAVFLDHQGATVEEIVVRLEQAGVPLLAVIDHHQPQDRVQAAFSDLQQTGSTATIYTGYLEQGALTMDTAVKEHRLAATALMHGILTDTENFRRAADEDFIAAAYLSRFRDTDKLVQILREARSKHAMDIIQRALANRTNVENFSIAGIGYVRSEDRDTIPQAADFLLSEENAHTAIVFGIMADAERGETLIGSLRTSKFNLDPDEFLKNVFGQDGGGRYYGGGRPLAGGFAIPLGFFSGGPDEDYRQLKWDVCDRQVRHRLFEKIGVGKS